MPAMNTYDLSLPLFSQNASNIFQAPLAKNIIVFFHNVLKPTCSHLCRTTRR